MVFRFGNGIFEPLWNRRYVDHVQITVAEDLGVEGRGEFYEEAGASRDILQNHLLQLLTLVAMEPPIAFEADALRDEKVRVLRAVDTDWTEARVRASVVRAPVHGGLGRRQARRRLSRGGRGRRRLEDRDLRRARSWRSRTGAGRTFPSTCAPASAWPRRATEIAIQFKLPPLMLFGESATPPEPNLLALRIQPDEGIMLRFAAKVPELGLDVRSVNMDFTYGLVVRARRAGGVRDAAPRRDARRRVAVHARRRGRGRVGHRHADHRCLAGVGQGRRPGQRHLLLRGRFVGP